MSEEFVASEIEGEQQSSAWIERTSTGKIKFGCKCYRLDLGDSVDVVAAEFQRLSNIVKKIEQIE